MQRNQHLKQLENYDKNIKTKTIRPKFFYKECCHCGMEFKKEPMYSLSYYLFGPFEIHGRIIYGCQHCFTSEQDFHNYAQEHGTTKYRLM